MAAGKAEADAGAEVEPDFSRGGVLPSFEFAFDSPNFSDRVLRIEIIASGDVGAISAVDFVRHRGVKGDKEQSADSSLVMVGAPILREKSVYINSAILAARSPFFLKLFSNGMKESDQMDPTIRIADAAENALLELLSFMYSGKLTTNEPTLVLDILIAADKFEVLSCMRHCSELLTSLPMTTESALLYLGHPCSISLAAEVQTLRVASKEFLAKKYKVLTKFTQHEFMSMPLGGIEAIFSSTDLHVPSEDSVYNFLVKWACDQYPESEERHRVWSSHLLPLVCFSHMTWGKLQEVLASTNDDDDVDHEETTKHITDMLLHKAYPAHEKRILAAEAATCWQVPQRTYLLKSVKVVEFDRPCQQVIVFLDLTRGECSRPFPTGVILSHAFHLAGQNFYLMPNCECDEKSKSCSFGLCIGTIEEPGGATCFTLDFEFAARKRPSVEFVRILKEKVIYTSGDWSQGRSDLFDIPWSTFMADDDLFINGVLHLRADLRVVEQPELLT